MEDFVMKLIEMSISASWLVLVVLVLRLLLKKSPRWIHVCLWALVAVRLVCPVSFETPVSLTPIDLTEQVMEALPNSYYGDSMIYSYGTENYDLAVSAGIQPEEGDNGYLYVLTQPDDPTKPVHTMQMLWDDIWLLGMTIVVSYALFTYIRLKQKVSASIYLDNGVFLCDYIDTPFILGIIRPRIYLPSSMEPDSASHVLAHERAHIARHDHWWKPLGYLLLTVHWFNPVMWLAYILLCRDIELACDEKVVKQMALPERKSYSDALLRCSVKRMHVAACPLAFGEVGVKERVKTVLNYKKPAFWIVLVAIIALIVTAVCFLTDPKADEPEMIGESPYTWTSNVEVWDIRKAWAYPYGQASYFNTIEGSNLEELLDILNGVQENEVLLEKPNGIDDPLWNYDGTSVNLYCADGTSINLRYVDDTVIFTAMTNPEQVNTTGYWVIENERLKSWLQNLANGGTYMLSDENRDEIRRLVRQENVQFFNPQEYAGMLFVGCAYDNGRGLGVACFEEQESGYKLLKLIRDEEVKPCASGGELYYCDYNQYRIFLILNESVTGMEWAGAYENTHAIDTHPGLVVAYYPEELDAMYRFRYDSAATMYMDWNNQTHGNPPAYSFDTFADPDDAYSICTNLRLNEVGLIWATELVETDRHRQAFTDELTADQIVQFLNLLHALPETAFEKAEYPAEESRWVDVFIQREPTAPYFQFMLQEDAVYFRFWSDLETANQPWKIDSVELKTFLDSIFTGDISQWHPFAPMVKTDGEILWSAEEIEIRIPQVTCFEYDVSAEGIRFKPKGLEGWVLLQHRTEPYASEEMGLRKFSGVCGGKSCVWGTHGDLEDWDYMDITVTSGDIAWNVLLLNAEKAVWVKEYHDEISCIIHSLDMCVSD